MRERERECQSRTEIVCLWLQIPQVGLFLFLCRQVLNLGDPPMYELERCLAMSRQSLYLQRLMTSLLKSPFQRKRSITLLIFVLVLTQCFFLCVYSIRPANPSVFGGISSA